MRGAESEGCGEQGQGCGEDTCAAARPQPLSGQGWQPGMTEPAAIVLRRPGSAPQPRACEQERPSPRHTGFQPFLGSRTMLNVTSSLPWVLLSPGQESLGCKRHLVPALGLLLGWEVTLEPVHLPWLELRDLPLPTLLHLRQKLVRKKCNYFKGTTPLSVFPCSARAPARIRNLSSLFFLPPDFSSQNF